MCVHSHMQISYDSAQQVLKSQSVLVVITKRLGGGKTLRTCLMHPLRGYLRWINELSFMSHLGVLETHLHLENLTLNSQISSILRLKVGVQTWGSL